MAKTISLHTTVLLMLSCSLMLDNVMAFGLPPDWLSTEKPTEVATTEKPTEVATTETSTEQVSSDSDTTDSTTSFSLPPIFSEKPTSSPSDVSSFHLPVLHDIHVQPQSEARLKNYRIPGLDELTAGHYLTFDTVSLDPINGVFRPSHDGLYFISATIHLQLPESSEVTEEPKVRRRRRRRQTAAELPAVTVAICIGDCTSSNVALMTSGALTGAETTLSVTGTLKLIKDQQISVNIMNKSSSQMTALNKSSFMAHRL